MDDHPGLDVEGDGSRTPGFAFDIPASDRRVSSTGLLLDALRHRKAGRRLTSMVTVALFLGGAGMFSYPFFTDVYTEQVVQTRLQEEFASIEVETFDEWEAEVSDASGMALTKMIVPDVEVETLVVEGVSEAALRAGAGHYPNTPLPGQPGNVAIAGHRTTYGKPFNRFDELEPGDDIWLVTPVGDHRYVVTDEPATERCVPLGEGSGGCVTDAKDWGVIAPTAQPMITLTTCHPKGSAAYRLIVRAVLADSLPPGTYEASGAGSA